MYEKRFAKAALFALCAALLAGCGNRESGESGDSSSALGIEPAPAVSATYASTVENTPAPAADVMLPSYPDGADVEWRDGFLMDTEGGRIAFLFLFAEGQDIACVTDGEREAYSQYYTEPGDTEGSVVYHVVNEGVRIAVSDDGTSLQLFDEAGNITPLTRLNAEEAGSLFANG